MNRNDSDFLLANPTKKTKYNGASFAAADANSITAAAPQNASSANHVDTAAQKDDWSAPDMKMMDRMESILSKMERKLSRVDHLENKCERLESRCSYLENSLQKASSIETSVESILTQIKALNSKVGNMEVGINETLKFHEMMIKNQSWKYSAQHIGRGYWIRRGWNDDYIQAINQFCEDIKACTIRMRLGEEDQIVTSDGDIRLEVDATHLIEEANVDALLHNDKLLPHWTEFANALIQYPPLVDHYLSHDDVNTVFQISNIQLLEPVCQQLNRALKNNRFKTIVFENNHFHQAELSWIPDLIDSTPKLEEFAYIDNVTTAPEFFRLWETIKKHPSLERVTLDNCFPTAGYSMLSSIIHEGLGEFTKISLNDNSIEIPSGNNVFRDFLASNPRLRELHLEKNELDDNDANSIAQGLRTNTNLRQIYLDGNPIKALGVCALGNALVNSSNLNTMSDCNHACRIFFENEFWDISSINTFSKPNMNRGGKLFQMLCESSSDDDLTNAEQFGEMSMKLFPSLLVAVQSYSRCDESPSSVIRAEALSIIYEILCKWEEKPFR